MVMIKAHLSFYAIENKIKFEYPNHIKPIMYKIPYA